MGTAANAGVAFLLMADRDLYCEPDALTDLVLAAVSGVTRKTTLTALFELHCRRGDAASSE